MFTRALNTLLFLAFMLIAGFAGYKFFFENKGPNNDPIRAIPPNAVAFLTGNNLVEFYRETDNTSLLWQDLKASGYIDNFDNQLDIWNTLDKKGALKSIANSPFILSFHPAGNGKAEYLLSVSLPGKNAEKVNEIVEQAKMTVTNVKNGIKLIKSPANVEWYYYNFENLVVFSPSLDLINASKLECEKVGDQKKFVGFYKLKSTIGDHVKSSLFIRNSEYTNLIAVHFRDELQKMFTQYNTGECGLYDLVIEPNAVLMRGFNWAPDSLNTKLNLLDNQQPVKPELIKMLPSSTQWFYFLGLSDFELFVKKVHADPEMRKQIEEFNSNYDVNLKQHLLSWAEGQLVYFSSSTHPKERLLLVKADESKNPLKEIEFLANRLDSANTENVNFNGKIIRRLNESNLFGLLLGDVFNSMDNPYYLQLDDIIVFSTSSEALIDYFTEIAEEKYLVRNVNFYDNLENHFSSGANVLFHTDFVPGNEMAGRTLA